MMRRYESCQPTSGMSANAPGAARANSVLPPPQARGCQFRSRQAARHRGHLMHAETQRCRYTVRWRPMR
eukprot:12405400-Alexandrium_andersonii.AAC.1